jgi:ATP/maltotriose-dependent transcriptional regulator MalT
MSFYDVFQDFTGRSAREVPFPRREAIAWRNDGDANDAIRTADRCKSPVPAPRRGALAVTPGAMNALAQERIAEGHEGHMLSIAEPHAPSVRPDPSVPPPAQVGLLTEGMNPGWCTMQQNLTGASLPQVRRRLSRAWRSMLASRIDEALDTVEQIEQQLGDVPPADAPRFRAATQLLRAAGLAFQDDSLGAVAIAGSYLEQGGGKQDHHAAATLCRLGFWQLGRFELFHSIPRHRPRLRWSKSWAISSMLDLSIEAAMALDHLNLSIARRLALDALNVAETALNGAGGLAALPACLAAQMLYEQGCLEQADTILRERLPSINAGAPIEAALRAYLVLARIAAHRMQYDFAALLLREAEALGERRGWPRLVAACLTERTSLLLQAGQVREGRLVLEYLDRYADAHRTGSGYATDEIRRYRALTRCRVSWAEAPSNETVAALRQLYHNALDKRNFYAGSGLAVELAGMLATIGETEEADDLFLRTVKVGAAAGLYQVFLEGGAESGMLLRRAWTRVEASRSPDRELLPYVASLLSRWESAPAADPSAPSRSRAGNTLTARERDILAMISQGFSNKRIARTLQISPETVKSHIKRIFSKLAASSRTEAVSRAGSLGLL